MFLKKCVSINPPKLYFKEIKIKPPFEYLDLTIAKCNGIVHFPLSLKIKYKTHF